MRGNGANTRRGVNTPRIETDEITSVSFDEKLYRPESDERFVILKPLLHYNAQSAADYVVRCECT
jgi:hypothetical protein